MKRSLLTLFVSCMALFAFVGPTPATAQALWCGPNSGWYGRCYMAYTVVQPVPVRPVVAAVPTVVYQRTMVPYRYTAVAYRPAVIPYTTVDYRPAVIPYAAVPSTRAAYAYTPGVRRVWIYE